MKTMRKLIAFLLVAVLALALGVTTFADTPADGTIVVNDAVDNADYTAYKIFDVTYTGTGMEVGAPHSYTIAAASKWLSVVQDYATAHPSELTLTLNSAGSYNVTGYDDTDGTGPDVALDAAAFAAYLIAALPTMSPAPEFNYAKASGGKAVITVGDAGYYLVDSTLGALCILETKHSYAEVNEKNAKPTVDKKIFDGSAYRDDFADVQIGTPITFTLTVNTGTEFSTGLGTGIDAGVTLRDDMTYFVPIEKSGTTDYITIAGAGWTKGINYTETWDPGTHKLEIFLTKSKLQSLGADQDIVITYQAMLNKNVSTGAPGNPNTVVLSYHSYTQSDTVYARTHKFDICKTDAAKKFLSDATGAKFRLYADNAGSKGAEVELIWDGSLHSYRPLIGTETPEVIDMSATGHGAKARVFGMSGTYWLEETAAPVGYNQLTGPVKIIVTENITNEDDVTGGVYTTGGVQVVNQTGSLLPETGGEGTRLLITCGCILFLGTAVVLVTKKRMYNKG